MRTFTGKLAVITGGGTGMGRELARQLAADGCSVAICDLNADTLDETRRLCEAEATDGEAVDGVRISTHECDVADEDAPAPTPRRPTIGTSSTA